MLLGVQQQGPRVSSVTALLEGDGCVTVWVWPKLGSVSYNVVIFRGKISAYNCYFREGKLYVMTRTSDFVYIKWSTFDSQKTTNQITHGRHLSTALIV